MTRNYVFLKIIIFFLFCGTLAAEQKSNLEVIDSLITIHVGEEILRSAAPGDSVTMIFQFKDQVVKNYVLQKLGNLLQKDSLIVFRNYNPNAAFQGIVVDFAEVKPNVIYSSPYNSSPLKAAAVKRIINLTVIGQVYRMPIQRILFSLSEQFSYEDEVPADRIDEMENSVYNFTNGQVQETSQWDTYFEPVLAISTIGVILFLFFSQRF